MMNFLNYKILYPTLLIIYIIIAFANWDYTQGRRAEDGVIYPISSFSMYNRAPEIEHRETLKKIRSKLR